MLAFCSKISSSLRPAYLVNSMQGDADGVPEDYRKIFGDFSSKICRSHGS